MSGEGAGGSGAAFEDHFPDGIKAGFTAPGEAPEVFFRDTLFGNVAVKVEVDDVESALREDQEAVVCAAKGRDVHAGAGSVGADQKGHAVAVAADIGLGFTFAVSFEVEEFEAVLGAFGEDVGIGSLLGGRIGNTEEKLGDVIAIVSVKKVATSNGTAYESHGRAQGAVDEKAHAVFGCLCVVIWWSVTSDVCAIISPVWIAGNAIPVEGGGVLESAKWHGGTRLDLVSARDDGGIQDPEELIGMAVGMAAGAGKGFGGGGIGVVKGNTSLFEGGRSGIVERDDGLHDRTGSVGQVDEGDGVGNGIKNPGSGGSAIRF